jgi:tetratricopeptide (TPR) repeat protein
LIGNGTNNSQLQAQGVDAMIASGGGDPTKGPTLYQSQGQYAMQAKDYAKAEAAFARWAQLAPNDPQIPALTGEVKFRQGKPQEALTMYERAIAARKAAGQPVPQNWYLFALQSAATAQMWPQAFTLSRALVTENPTPKNWRSAINIYRQSSPNLDTSARVDIFRLMRATKSLETSDDYLALADLLARGRFYAESKAVIDEGVAAGKLTRSNRDAAEILAEVGGHVSGDLAALPGLEGRARSGANGEMALNVANGYYGHGNYAKAIEYYRLALQKGGVDSNLVNTRLGMALAQAGQRAEAEAAFKAVSGQRSGIASLWLLWLGQRA